MRNTLMALIATLLSLGVASEVQADTIEVTVSFRERIALPPDAELYVQLLDGSRADPSTRRVSAQRYAMDAVPMSVLLSYDPHIVNSDGAYSITATIWSDGRPLFRTETELDVLGSDGGASVDMTLTMVAEPEPIAARQVAGVRWAATEISGQPWEGDEPATLVFDEEMNFAIFAGCNRLSGKAILTEHTISFPANIAATMMACSPEVEDRERAIVSALGSVSGYVRYGTGLVLTDVNGAAVLHFEDRPE